MTVTALVLAGQREGRIDPLAARAGLTLKCMVPVAGRPMIAHVLDVIAAVPGIGPVIVSVKDPEAVGALPEAEALRAAGRLSLVQAHGNLADSIIAALDGRRYPVLVTTADNVLLTPATIDEIMRAATGADVAVAFARRQAVLDAWPEGQRRFYAFSDDAYSNCNTYVIANPAALSLVEVFRGGGQFAKHPMRIVRAFGLLNLVRFRLGIGTLERAFGRFSRRFGHCLRPVIVSNGETAIDVDNVRTRAIATAILTRRKRHDFE